MKAFSRFLSVFLVLSLMLCCGAFAAQADTEAGEEPSIQDDSSSGLFLALSEETSQSLSFPLTEAQAAQVEEAGADQVTWTLHRKAPYANPANGEFIPLHGEEKMFPNEKETIDFAAITYENTNAGNTPFSMERFETTLDGTTLKLDFEILALPLFFTWEMRVCLTKSAAGSWTSAVSSPLPPSWMEILLLQLNRKGSRGRHLRYPGGADTSICRLRIHRPRVLFPGVPL